MLTALCTRLSDNYNAAGPLGPAFFVRNIAPKSVNGFGEGAWRGDFREGALEKKFCRREFVRLCGLRSENW